MTLIEVFAKLEAAGRRVTLRPDGVGGAMRIDVLVPASGPSAPAWVTARLWDSLCLATPIDSDHGRLVLELARRAGVEL